MSARVLILGLGSIGRRHVKNLRKLGVSEFIAVRSGRGRAVSTDPGIQELRGLDAALEAKPDFALICTPPPNHVEAARQIAAAGCPFLLEKPISDSMEGVSDLAALVREQGIWTLVGFNLRFHPALRKARELIRENRIGRVLHLRAEVGQYLPDWHPEEDYRESYSAQRSLGGGAPFDLIHEMDYASWLAGPLRSAACVADRISDLEIDSEDVAEFIVRFDGGAMGSIHMNYLERAPHRAFRVIGAEGTLIGDLLTNELRFYDANAKAWTDVALGVFERNDMYVDEMQHLLDCAAGRATPVVDLDAAIPVHAVTVDALARCRGDGVRPEAVAHQ